MSASPPVKKDPRLDQLSDRQKECLRLVYRHYGAKQIGRRLNISPNTVNRHLQDARFLLGLSRSIDVAALLIEYEGGDRLTTEPITIDPGADVGDDNEAAARISARTAARNRNLFGALHRVGLIIAIAFGAVALASALLGGFEMIAKVFHAERIDISDTPYRK